ncbi:hypothetical protein HRbin36_00146 [bacterium HR36]|nr:hypothetical protein HRbin36_00146 [bacterium HR36]
MRAEAKTEPENIGSEAQSYFRSANSLSCAMRVSLSYRVTHCGRAATNRQRPWY